MTQLNHSPNPQNLQLTWKIADLHDIRCRLAFLEGEWVGLSQHLENPVRHPLDLSHRQKRLKSFEASLLSTLNETPPQSVANSFLEWVKNPIQTMDRYFEYGFGLYWLYSLTSQSQRQLDVFSLWSKFIFADSFQVFSLPPPLELVSLHSQIQLQNLDLTIWMSRVLTPLAAALAAYNESYKKQNKETQRLSFYEKYDLNRRQRSILVLLNTPNESGAVKKSITNRELVQLLGGSRESMKRDLTQLCQFELIEKSDGRGRSTSYVLKDIDGLS